MTKTFLLDLGERAVKTFLQAALAVIAVQFVGSGVGSDVFDGSAWQKIGTAALAAGVAAVVSLLTSVVSAAKTGTASASTEVAQKPSEVQLKDGTRVVGVLPASAVVSVYDPRHDLEDDGTQPAPKGD